MNMDRRHPLPNYTDNIKLYDHNLQDCAVIIAETGRECPGELEPKENERSRACIKIYVSTIFE